MVQIHHGQFVQGGTEVRNFIFSWVLDDDGDLTLRILGFIYVTYYKWWDTPVVRFFQGYSVVPKKYLYLHMTKVTRVPPNADIQTSVNRAAYAICGQFQGGGGVLAWYPKDTLDLVFEDANWYRDMGGENIHVEKHPTGERVVEEKDER